MAKAAVTGTRKRPRWVCRLFGHRYRDPFFGHTVHFFLPSAEGHMGWTDPRGHLIGTCRCGAEWRSGGTDG